MNEIKINITLVKLSTGEWGIEFPVFDNQGNLANDKISEFLKQHEIKCLSN